ncbi:hypothetical protein BpHYR1_003482 [Brachionus plicatilis]|uniref:Uncharacterized protein n=1 Tax=Brachionus plicatilis TaxID=10195 RepID=A0A3M7T0P0_BRAPC|nr:hypothetical protein BpHYR1_003482 [Brachionus plicatilis]
MGKMLFIRKEKKISKSKNLKTDHLLIEHQAAIAYSKCLISCSWCLLKLYQSEIDFNFLALYSTKSVLFD